MRRFLSPRLALLSLIVVGLIGGGAYLINKITPKSAGPTPEPIYPYQQAMLEDAVTSAVQAVIDFQAQASPAIFLNETQIDNVTLSASREWATAWITPLDPDTGQVIPMEPGLVILQLVDGAWKATLPDDPAWSGTLAKAPADLISAERRKEWTAVAKAEGADRPSGPLTGYRLPWANGLTMRLTQSVGHDRYTPSGNAHFSFDFAKPGYPSGLFDVHAARPGIVKRVRWTQPNGSTSEPGNYLVLEDNSTYPATYQLYLHFAQNSIPEELRTVGAMVQRGQFIGQADDTGVSSGNHLHFMVHTNPNSYWGTSVDITFEDVAINGGRPRIQSDQSYCKSSDVCTSFQTDYISNNIFTADKTAPTGGMSAPATGQAITDPILKLEGWAQDSGGAGLAGAQFMVRSGGAWQHVGDAFGSGEFSYDLDVCQAQLPPGPLDLMMEILDRAGNRAPGMPGLTHITLAPVCSEVREECTPATNQVALFSEKDYQGDCALLKAGSYLNPADYEPLDEDRLMSILIGSQVQATLYADTGLTGRAETLQKSDPSLGDNRIGKRAMSSLRVQTRGLTPGAPTLVSPAAGASFPANASLSLSWHDYSGGLQFQARLQQGAVTIQTSPWQSETAWRLSGLPQGDYTWQARSRSGSSESTWSYTRSLRITAATTETPPERSVPFTDTLESEAAGWSSSIEWALDPTNHTPGGQSSYRYAPGIGDYFTGAPNSGYLDMPPVRLLATGESILRFWYQHDTESSETHWDQRWVQISADGGPYVDLLQLSGDLANNWLQAPPVSLKAYAGQTVRLRFYFATLDGVANSGKGWFIDDVSITQEPLPACTDSDSRPDLALELDYGAPRAGVICPNGDVDTYVFEGTAGEQVGAWLEAAVMGSPLDGHLTLLDADGVSVLEKNDDQVQFERPDPWLTYRLPRTGKYYLMVKAWDYPTSGSPAHTYALHLERDAQPPAGQFINPKPDGALASGMIQIVLQASDSGSGVSKVEFLFHSSDWLSSDWVLLGDDWEPSDGWSFNYYPPGSSLASGALYVKIYDWAGNWTGLGLWKISGPALFVPVIIK